MMDDQADVTTAPFTRKLLIAMICKDITDLHEDYKAALLADQPELVDSILNAIHRLYGELRELMS